MADMMSANDVVAKWQKRTKAAAPEYQAGVNRVTVAPGEKAAQRQDAMLAGVQDAISSGRWARGVRAVTLEEWKNKAANVGTARIAAGVDAATSKMLPTFEKILTNVRGAQAAISSMPKGDLESNINRAVSYMRYMAERPVK